MRGITFQRDDFVSEFVWPWSSTLNLQPLLAPEAPGFPKIKSAQGRYTPGGGWTTWWLLNIWRAGTEKHVGENKQTYTTHTNPSLTKNRTNSLIDTLTHKHTHTTYLFWQNTEQVLFCCWWLPNAATSHYLNPYKIIRVNKSKDNRNKKTKITRYSYIMF